MCYPADSSANSKHHGEHRGWNPQGPIDNARVEVDVRVEVLFDEVFVLERNLFELQGQIEHRGVRSTHLFQYLVAHRPDNRRPRIKILVDTMTEAHQPERVFFVFCFGNEFRDVFGITDLAQHAQHSFVRTTVGRAPQSGYSSCNCRVGIGAGTACHPYRRCRTILLVVGM